MDLLGGVIFVNWQVFIFTHGLAGIFDYMLALSTLLSERLLTHKPIAILKNQAK